MQIFWKISRLSIFVALRGVLIYAQGDGNIQIIRTFGCINVIKYCMMGGFWNYLSFKISSVSESAMKFISYSLAQGLPYTHEMKIFPFLCYTFRGQTYFSFSLFTT